MWAVRNLKQILAAPVNDLCQWRI